MFSFWDDNILLQPNIPIDINKVNSFINGNHNTHIAIYQQHIGQSINSYICQAFLQEIPYKDHKKLFQSLKKQVLLKSLPYIDYYQAQNILTEYYRKINPIIKILNHINNQ